MSFMEHPPLHLGVPSFNITVSSLGITRSSTAIPLYLILPLTLFAIITFRTLRAYHALSHIPGPSNPSIIFGNLLQLLLPHTYGSHEFKWQETYGPFYRINAPFFSTRLMVSDPVAMKSIYNDTTTWQRSEGQQWIVDMLVGKKSVFYVGPEEHKRIRSVMNVAFAPGIIRGLTPAFKRIAEKMGNRWEAMLRAGEQLNGSESMDVYPSLHDATLDAVGEGAMGYEFGSLENSDCALATSHRNIIALSGLHNPFDVFVDYLIPLIPPSILSIFLRLPTPSFKSLWRSRELARQVSEELIRDQINIVQMEGENGDSGRTDVTYALVKANTSKKAGLKLTIEEMEQQIPSLLIAGQDTTGKALSWSLFRLAEDPVLQEKIREEVMAAYEAAPGGDISYQTIEGLKWLNAFLKETLRVHPGLPMTDRVATQDAVIPLAVPLTTTSGRRITEVKVPKGTHVVMGIASHNRLSSVWGGDAQEFKPARWLDPVTGSPVTPSRAIDGGNGASFGPYANLATFLGGPRLCIGWKFAVTELQVLFTELVRRFKFSLPPEDKYPELSVRMSVSVNMIPVVESGNTVLPVVIEPL